MKTISVKKDQPKLLEVIKSVADTQSPVLLKAADGALVKVVPVTAPSKVVKNRPVYTAQDRALRKSPFPNEPRWD